MIIQDKNEMLYVELNGELVMAKKGLVFTFYMV